MDEKIKNKHKHFSQKRVEGIPDFATKPVRALHAKIAIIYILLGFAWIKFSDAALFAVVSDHELLTSLQTMKGWLFVLFTGFFLFLLLKSSISLIEKTRLSLIQFQSRFQYHLRLEECLARLSSALVAEKDADIVALLGILGQALNTDRAFIILVTEDIQKVICFHEWVSPGNKSLFPLVNNLNKIQKGWWLKEFEKGEPVIFDDFSSLKDLAPSEYQSVKDESGKSMVLVPMIAQNDFLGALGMDVRHETRNWTNEEVRIIRTAAEIFNSYFQHQHARTVLEESEERFRSAFRFTPDCMIITRTRDDRIIEVNQAVYDSFQFKPEEVIGKHSYEMKGWDTREDLDSALKEIMEKGFVKNKRLRFWRRNNELREGMLSSQAIFLNGEHHIISMLHDITDLMKTEEEIQFKSLLLEQVRNAVVALDMEGSVKYSNVFTQTLFGWQEEEIRGTKFFEKILPGNSLDLMEPILRWVNERGYWEGELQAWNRHSESFPAYFHLMLRKNAQGVTTGFLIVVTDISAQKVAEIALRRERDFSRSLIQASPAFFVAIGADGRVLMMNQIMMQSLGYTEEEVIGRDFLTNFVPSDEREKVSAVFKEIINGHQWISIENQVQTKDGRVLVIEWRLRPMLNAKDEVEYFFGLGNDITERKKSEAVRRELEAQLRQQQKLESIGTLASGVAHEINNPINGIMNYAELLIDGTENQESNVFRFSSEILVESERIAEIVRNLLTFARQESKARGPADLHELVDATLTLVRTLMRKDQITLSVDVPENLPPLYCREQQIQQVLMNLLTNSRDSLNMRYQGFNEDKIIRLYAELFKKDDDDWIRISVEDHGMGIDTQIHNRIFDPFFTTKPANQGTGLGLSVSHGIVKDHGGEIRVESETGRFAVFHVELPLNLKEGEEE